MPIYLKAPPPDGVTVKDEKSVKDSEIHISGTKVRYDEKAARVYVNESQYISGVTKPVWEFNLGGYQVVKKWLFERNKRNLEHDEFLTFRRMVGALTTTLACMTAIDANIGTLLD